MHGILALPRVARHATSAKQKTAIAETWSTHWGCATIVRSRWLKPAGLSIANCTECAEPYVLVLPNCRVRQFRHMQVEGTIPRFSGSSEVPTDSMTSAASSTAGPKKPRKCGGARHAKSDGKNRRNLHDQENPRVRQRDAASESEGTPCRRQRYTSYAGTQATTPAVVGLTLPVQINRAEATGMEFTAGCGVALSAAISGGALLTV